MSGLDYTKKPEISNMQGGLSTNSHPSGKGVLEKVKDIAYKIVFLWRTRFEKWLLFTSLIFGLTGLVCAGFMIGKINKPAQLALNCDYHNIEMMMKREKENEVNQAIKTQKNTKKTSKDR
jgi:hypothetical protein